MPLKTIHVAMAEDHKMVASALAEMLRQHEGIDVAIICPDGNKLLQYLNGHWSEIDVVILDINMPVLDGISLTPIIKNRFPRIKVIILSMYYTPQIMEQVKTAGADSFVHKADEPELLVRHITEVAEGKKIFPQYQPVTSVYTHEIPEDVFMKISVLTEREKQIARHIRDGYTTPEIAGMLNLSKYTVDTHRKNILQKLHLKSTAELIRFATENKL